MFSIHLFTKYLKKKKKQIIFTDIESLCVGSIVMEYSVLEL